MAKLLVLACAYSAAAFAQFGDLAHIGKGHFNSQVEYHEIRIPKGGEAVLADLAGPGKITYFYITDNSRGKFYRGLVLKVYWDGETEPSIDVPLSDFFGALESETIDFQSAMMQINHYCYMSYLPMPFSRRARFVLANDGDEEYRRSVAYGIDFEQGQEFANEHSRLHSAWARSNPTRNGMHTILEARGRGHYVGNFLQVNTLYNGWWGEGDTIFHVDGAVITHTPGTEDEYGACWGFEHLFSYLYSGYIEMRDGKNRMYRWYVANPVRFQSSLTVEIQNQHMENHKQVPASDDYTSVAFWYQQEPHRHFTLQTYAERMASPGNNLARF